MTDKTTTQLLEELTDLMAHVDLLNFQERELIDKVIPEEIKEKIAEIKIEIGDRREALAGQIEELKRQVQDQVLKAGETISGGGIQAIHQKGRISWDTDQLTGMMVFIPELAQARKVGKPFVQFKMVD